jgi:hypothetical protein
MNHCFFKRNYIDDKNALASGGHCHVTYALVYFWSRVPLFERVFTCVNICVFICAIFSDASDLCRIS